MSRHAIIPTTRATRRLGVLLLGATLLLAGIALLVLPGPGLLTLALGLAILGVEFGWARRGLARLRVHADAALTRWERRLARLSSRRDTWS